MLITGGYGRTRRQVARHLVTARGARHLLLTSRRGGADDLVAELTALGADVRVAACDAADRDALAALLSSIPAEHPLTAVVHAARSSRTPRWRPWARSLDRVLRPKVAAAWNCDADRRTRTDGLRPLLLRRRTGRQRGTGQLRGGQRTFLDALAEHRRADLPAVSLAWGMWRDGMANDLDHADRARHSPATESCRCRPTGRSRLDSA